ncbi:SH3 domain-containing protein [Phyllosticta citrichinensis]|uniref:SH3 domain-containing protein n=1 Tax=Phyllosticta citrichinensis TaxID=1130410 RepID=A0ABR1Y488_9PEZI
MGIEEFNVAMANRSMRTIKTELAFLADSGHISQEQMANILTQLPETPPILPVADTTAAYVAPVQPQPVQPIASPPPPAALPVRNATPAAPSPAPANNEKVGYYSHNPTPPPPAYQSAPPGPPTLAAAIAMYTYAPSDAGDLALAPNDRVLVTEYMNADWWKGRSERTGQEGIFPRSYVRVDEKGAQAQPTPADQSMSYGNMPMAVSQGGPSNGQPAAPGQGGKGAEMGKKFGKKLGNATIFGAGATLGSNIVNGIL